MKKLIYQYVLKFYLKLKKKVLFGKGSVINKNSFFEGNNYIGNNSIFFNSYIGKGSYISGDCKLNKIHIGHFCSVGANLKNQIGRHPTDTFVSTHPAFFSIKKQAGFTFVSDNQFQEHKYIDVEKKFFNKIGNDVWIGNDVTLFDSVIIGDGAIIATGSIVTKNVEAYTIVGGIPAKLIRNRFNKEISKKLIKFKWWEKDFDWIKANHLLFSNIEEFISQEINTSDDN